MAKKIIVWMLGATLIFILGSAVRHQTIVAGYKRYAKVVMTVNIAKYHNQKGKLPLSWEEFTTWAVAEHLMQNAEGSVRILKPRFALKWGAHLEKDKPEIPIFFAVDPEYKSIESSASQLIYDNLDAPVAIQRSPIPASNDAPHP